MNHKFILIDLPFYIGCIGAIIVCIILIGGLIIWNRNNRK